LEFVFLKPACSRRPQAGAADAERQTAFRKENMRAPVRDADRPDILVFPPILLGGAMLLGFVLDWLHPIPLLPPAVVRILGVTLFVVSGTLAWSAQAVLRQAGTNISPNQPTLALVTDGPYLRTRNPLYLAGLGVYLGVACFINGIAPFLLFAPLVALLHWGIVRREERYLGAKFGEAHRAYQNQVRRWL
jgi:protein-S-isoprenylcysteine O-methyltransferase Ste14